MDKLWKRKFLVIKSGKNSEKRGILDFNNFFHTSFPHGKVKKRGKSGKKRVNLKSYPQKWHSWFQHEKIHVLQGIFKICPQGRMGISHSFQHSFQQMWKTHWKVGKEVLEIIFVPAPWRIVDVWVWKSFTLHPDLLLCFWENPTCGFPLFSPAEKIHPFRALMDDKGVSSPAGDEEGYAPSTS